MAMRNDLTAEYIRQVLNYDPDAGELRWRHRASSMFNTKKRTRESICAVWNIRFAGMLAGSINPEGQSRIVINGRHYRTHRIIWLWMTGTWPKEEIDHIDCNELNNKWCNLREASRSQNEMNKGVSRNNSSGAKGVSWNRRDKKWLAQIIVNGRYKYLGYFSSKCDAIAAYRAASADLHGQFSRTG